LEYGQAVKIISIIYLLFILIIMATSNSDIKSAAAALLKDNIQRGSNSTSNVGAH
jgi:hypothetical protein